MHPFWQYQWRKYVVIYDLRLHVKEYEAINFEHHTLFIMRGEDWSWEIYGTCQIW